MMTPFWLKAQFGVQAMLNFSAQAQRQAVAVGVGLSPCVVVSIWIHAENLLAAMLCMHTVCMLMLPAIVIISSSPKVRKWYSTHGQDLLVPSGTHILRGLLLGLVLGGGLIGGFLLVRCKSVLRGYISDFDRFCARGLDRNIHANGFEGFSKPKMIAVALYFSTVNPFVEELFWRVFLHKQVEIDPDTTGGDSVDRERKVLDHPQVPTVSEAWRWLISAMYASYHYMVVWTLLFNVGGVPLWPMLGFLGLTFLGRFYVWLREQPDSWGLWSVIVSHALLDAGVCVIALGPAFEIF